VKKDLLKAIIASDYDKADKIYTREFKIRAFEKLKQIKVEVAKKKFN